MNFSRALEELKLKKSVARKGWNASGIFIKAQFPDKHSKMTGEYIYINTKGSDSNTKCLMPWIPGQTDLFAGDWVVVDI